MGPAAEEGGGTFQRSSTKGPIGLGLPGPSVLQREQPEPEELGGSLRLPEPHVVLLSAGRRPPTGQSGLVPGQRRGDRLRPGDHQRGQEQEGDQIPLQV